MAARNDVEQEERKEQQYDKAYYQALKKYAEYATEMYNQERVGRAGDSASVDTIGNGFPYIVEM
jgi:hypothetical protein